MRVAIVDYGMCNLLNVARGFEAVGANVRLVEHPKEVQDAERLVVPGVGAFRDSIKEVKSRGFDEAIRRFVETGRPFFGICVGMQMLFDVSQEFGEHEGLGLIPGKVRPVPSTTMGGDRQRVPHIGWNELVPPHGKTWDGTVLGGHEGKRPALYFVHSFSAVPEREKDRLANCVYGGHSLCAAIQKDNIVATQFHPERSGKVGLEILRAFIGS